MLFKENSEIKLARQGMEVFKLPQNFAPHICRKVDLRGSKIFFVTQRDELVSLDLYPIIGEHLAKQLVPTPEVLGHHPITTGVRDFCFDEQGLLYILRSGTVEKVNTTLGMLQLTFQ